MSALNNFSVSVARSLRRLRNKDLTNDLPTRSPKRRGSSASKELDPKMKMDKCLIVSKATRYDYEKHSHDNISDVELEKILRQRGSDYDMIMANHREQKAFEEDIAKNLKDMGIKVEMASRRTYNDELIKWCDVVVPCGGDGTFLLAASRVRDPNKPVIGLNSAPHKSVGRLCLPTWCSNDVKGALHALKECCRRVDSVGCAVQGYARRSPANRNTWTPSRRSTYTRCITAGTRLCITQNTTQTPRGHSE